MNNIRLNTTYATRYFIVIVCIYFACNGCKPKVSAAKSVVKQPPPICTMNKAGSKSMSCHAGAPSRFKALSGNATF